MPTELKPCPFCGGHAILCKEHEVDIYADIETALVKCDCCGANTGAYFTNGVYGTTTTVQDAINAWNRRSLPRKTKREIVNKHAELTAARRKLYANKEKQNDQT